MDENSIKQAKLYNQYKFILPLGYFIISTLLSILLYVLRTSVYGDYLEIFLNYTRWLSDYILTSGARDNFAINFIFYTLILYLIKILLLKNSSNRFSKISIFSFAIIYSLIVGLFDHPGFHNLFPPFAFMNMLAEVLTMPGVYFQTSVLGDSQANLFANFWYVSVNAIFANLLIWFVFGYIIDRFLKKRMVQNPPNFPQKPLITVE